MVVGRSGGCPQFINVKQSMQGRREDRKVFLPLDRLKSAYVINMYFLSL